ncbi:hypothetical protein SAMN05216228_101696 [Rhizobium tibeticum]|uniref:Uncharacterized protein n=1 Tax=Rhizobium tibeticum TaxID=501024 RepID=A0A1H8PBF7_9HYPH|nr:hypothetical protein [Rhizobium tibeticum]SEI02571.1 hypothetical protein RTCCBAU85039_3803 [Rhizobium tibeticum]SEO38958.1 hypothetical protein SAMN05216228_101696 [Rhizobium tibeticum]
MAAILLVAALDAGRFHWLAVPARAVLSSYVGVLAGIAVTGWAQAVNPFFGMGLALGSFWKLGAARCRPCYSPWARPGKTSFCGPSFLDMTIIQSDALEIGSGVW